jgi:ABC-type multidrug transport system permease subunit
MNTLKIILASLFLLIMGITNIILGFTALSSPQKIVNFNLKIVRKLNYCNRMQKHYILKAEQGDYENSWRKSAVVLIIVGLIFIYALISYLIKQWG